MMLNISIVHSALVLNWNLNGKWSLSGLYWPQFSAVLAQRDVANLSNPKNPQMDRVGNEAPSPCPEPSLPIIGFDNIFVCVH